MGQIDIALSQPKGFKSLGAAVAHRKIVKKALALRAQATELAEESKSLDRVDFDTTLSDINKDLASQPGHVIVLNEDDSEVGGIEVKFDPEQGNIRSFQASTNEGDLSHGPVVDGKFSPTYKWETGNGEDKTTTYLKFDDERGVLSILDADNDVPAFLGDVDRDELNELTGSTAQGFVPIVVLSKGLLLRT